MKSLAKTVFVAVLFATFPAHSADLDPFSADPSEWMSPEHYADKSERFPALFPQKEPEPAPVQVEAKVEEKQTLIPTRPLNLPVMPGINKGYELLISSTVEDEPVLAQPSRPLNLPVLPGFNQRKYDTPEQENTELANDTNDQTILKLAGSLWQDAKSATKLAKSGKPILNIRLAGLPDSSIAPVPAGAATKKRSVIAASTPVPEVEPQPTTRNPEVCAAVTAHKKRQLAAIESDRQTLNALQAAIAELGLSKQLDFMNSAKGSLNIQANAESAQKPVGDISISAPSAKN